jgi:hypothetical protein
MMRLAVVLLSVCLTVRPAGLEHCKRAEHVGPFGSGVVLTYFTVQLVVELTYICAESTMTDLSSFLHAHRRHHDSFRVLAVTARTGAHAVDCP